MDHKSSGDVGDRWVGKGVCRGFGRRKHGDSFYRHTVFISLYLCLEETAPDPLLCPIYGMQDTKDASSIILPPDPHHQTQHLVSECSPPTLIPASPNIDSSHLFRKPVYDSFYCSFVSFWLGNTGIACFGGKYDSSVLSCYRKA